jgi:hypothetical protein
MPKRFGLRQAVAWPPNNLNPPRSIFEFESMEGGIVGMCIGSTLWI